MINILIFIHFPAMNEIFTKGIKEEINNNEFLNSKKLLLELLNTYSYNDIMACLISEENEKKNFSLEIDLKKLVEKVDIEQLSQLLMDEEIIKCSHKIENNNKTIIQKSQSETIQSTFDNNLNLEDNIDKNEVKLKKNRKKSKPYISKVIYRKEDNIYFFRYIAKKIGENILLRCQDKHCGSKATYNFSSKEINIYEEHSIPIEKHIYLSDKSINIIKELVNFMKINPEVKNIEIYSDSEKKIIEKIIETKSIKNEKSNSNFIQINDLNKINVKKFKNKKIQFKILKYKKKIKEKEKDNISEQLSEESKNENNDLNSNNNEIIMNLNEEEEKNENDINDDLKIINKKKVYFEIKDKYIKYKKLLTRIEQECFGENKRLGTHFYKNEKGEIYNYFGNNKEIKNYNMNYRCTLKGCKSLAIYNIKLREFKIIREHTKPYKDHFCSNPNNNKTKQFVEYLKNNQDLKDLQIILI